MRVRLHMREMCATGTHTCTCHKTKVICRYHGMRKLTHQKQRRSGVAEVWGQDVFKVQVPATPCTMLGIIAS